MKYNNKIFQTILLATCIFFITINARNIIAYVNTNVITDDLSQDYISSLQVLRKKSIYNILKDNDVIDYLNINGYKKPFSEILNNYHPPIVSIIYTPLSYFFSYKTSVFIISLLIFLSIFFIINVLCNKYKFNKLLVFAIYLSSSPFLYLIQWRNIDWIILLLISLIFYLEFKNTDNLITNDGKSYKKDLSIGILLALATQIKVFPIILLCYFLIQKRTKVFISFIVSNILLFILTTQFVQFQDILLYYNQIAQEDLQIFACGPGNLSILHLILTIFGWKYNKFLIPVFNLPLLTMPLFFLTQLSIIFINSYFCLKITRVKCFKIYDLLFSLWLVSFFFFSPILWDYSLNYLLIPLCILFYRRQYLNFNLLKITIISLYLIFHLYRPTTQSNLLYVRHLIIILLYLQNIFCIKNALLKNK